MSEIKTLNGHTLADVKEREQGEASRNTLRALKRKVLAITGGMLDLNRVVKTNYNERRCVVTEVTTPSGSSAEEAIIIKCGHFDTKAKMRLDSGNKYTYRISNINNVVFDPESLFTDVNNAATKTLIEVNIDNTVYSDLGALKTVGFEFKRLCLIYESEGAYGTDTPFICQTAICVTPDAMTVAETLFDVAAAEDGTVTRTPVTDAEGIAKMPSGFITSSSGRVKVKGVYGNRMVFGLSGSASEPPYHNTYFQTVENDGCSTFKKISFGGCE